MEQEKSQGTISSYAELDKEVKQRDEENKKGFLKFEKTGKHLIKFKTELNFVVRSFKNNETGKPDEKLMASSVVEFEGKEYKWEFAKGGSTSLYGQLIKVANKLGKLQGEVIHLNTINDGKKNMYSIDEALI